MKIQKIIDSINPILRKIMVVMRIKRGRSVSKSYVDSRQISQVSIPPGIQRAYIKKWSRLYPEVSLTWLRRGIYLFGEPSLHYIPEDIYSAVIERIMNNANYAHYEQNKNNYERFLSQEFLPEAVVRRIDGDYFNHNYQQISKNQAIDIFQQCNFDLFVKPSVDTKSGQNTIKLKRIGNDFYRAEEKIDFDFLDKNYSKDFIIQKCLKQHDFFAQFHPESLNTLRIYTYRSVKDYQSHILVTIFRIGAGQSVVDNFSAGGMAVEIMDDGKFNDFAIDKKSVKHYQTFESNTTFQGLVLPHHEKIFSFAKEISQKMIHHRLLALDLTLDEDSQPKLIEINILGAAIFSTLSFGESKAKLINEIIDYCANNKNKDDQAIIRL